MNQQQRRYIEKRINEVVARKQRALPKPKRKQISEKEIIKLLKEAGLGVSYPGYVFSLKDEQQFQEESKKVIKQYLDIAEAGTKLLDQLWLSDDDKALDLLEQGLKALEQL